MLVFLFLISSGWSMATAQEQPRTPPPPDGSQAPAEVVHYGYNVVRSYPHDRQAFTQGLVYENGVLYEGTGLRGRSAIFQRDLKTGETLKMLRLPEKYFGEGITLFGDKLIQLTWQSKTGFVYSKDAFTPRGQFHYATEGWGITNDGKRLLYSDGTATLHWLDPNTFAETGRIEVRDRNRPVRHLNELEFIDGLIYANIWPTDRIAIIDPQTGRVSGWLDLTGLYTPPASEQSDAVLNGIAWLPESKHLLVTGKLWPKLYEIELVPESVHQPR